jgi:hypothetical protein
MSKDPAFFAKHMLASQPHPGQVKWLRNAHESINVLVPGNRWGKTYVNAMSHIWYNIFKVGAPAGLSPREWLAYPYQTVSTAPSFDQAGLTYKAARQLLAADQIRPLVKKWRATPFPAVEFANGSIMHVRSLHDDARYVDGHGYRFLSVDEAGWIPNLRTLIDSVLLMRLAGGGQINLIGTPKGKGDFYWYYRRGELGMEDFYSQRGSIFDNTFLPEEDLKMRARLLASSNEKLRQQVLYGEFMDFEGLAFTSDQIENAIDVELPARQPYREGRRYVTAWDLGRKTDFTVGITLDITSRPWTMVRYDRLNRVPWEQIYALIDDVRKEYDCNWAHIDATGPGGDVVEEEMLKRGMPINAVKTQSSSAKLSLINGIQAAFDEGRRIEGDIEVLDHAGVLTRRSRLQEPGEGEWGLLRFPEEKQLISELETYMLDDKKLVQDSVFALGLAVAAARDTENLNPPAIGGLYYEGSLE